MNSCLYILPYQKNYAPYYATTLAMSMQNNQNFHLLNLVDDHTAKNIYENYFANYSNLYFSVYKSSIAMDIFKQYLYKYQWYIFLSPQSLYDKTYHDEVQQLCNANTADFVLKPLHSSGYNDNSIVITNDSLKEYINQDYTLQTLYNKYQTNNSDILKPSHHSIMINNHLNYEYIFYQDEHCIFGHFSQYAKLQDSVVYINKNNNKAYNISNQLIGTVINRSDKEIKIQWQNDLYDIKTNTVIYKYNNTTKSYIAK